MPIPWKTPGSLAPEQTRTVALRRAGTDQVAPGKNDLLSRQ